MASEQFKYNPRSGLWVKAKEKPERVLPWLSDGEDRKTMAAMLLAQREYARRNGYKVIANDPDDFIGVMEQPGRGTVLDLARAGLFLANPGLFFHISEGEWPLEERLGLMVDLGLFSPRSFGGCEDDIQRQVDYFRDVFPGRQRLATGMHAVSSLGPESTAQGWKTAKRRSNASSNRIRKTTKGCYRSEMLGAVEGLDLVICSQEFRNAVFEAGHVRTSDFDPADETPLYKDSDNIAGIKASRHYTDEGGNHHGFVDVKSYGLAGGRIGWTPQVVLPSTVPPIASYFQN
ncbi:hypothetical protein FWD20_01295 [Candidatus Saccharibacteria bacterium]|nr:hypothetical protein [Candidatus Saccharibacteria bacterium]